MEHNIKLTPAELVTVMADAKEKRAELIERRKMTCGHNKRFRIGQRIDVRTALITKLNELETT